MYKKILVPIDGSELSFMAVAGAASFAKPLGAEVIIMTVVEPYSYANLSGYQPESIDSYDQRVRAQAIEMLVKALTYFDRLGVQATECIRKSFSPSEAIVEMSKELGCDCIFMASHGRKGLAAVLIGSETQKVLTHSEVPVMVYR